MSVKFISESAKQYTNQDCHKSRKDDTILKALKKNSLTMHPFNMDKSLPSSKFSILYTMPLNVVSTIIFNLISVYLEKDICLESSIKT
jgi:hypothetical protein